MRVGDVVVCVNAAKQPHTVEELNKDVPNWVEQDKKYTIRAILDHDFVTGILLEEVENPIKYFRVVDKFLEPAFAHWRFRKLELASATVEEELKIAA